MSCAICSLSQDILTIAADISAYSSTSPSLNSESSSGASLIRNDDYPSGAYHAVLLVLLLLDHRF